MIFTDNDIKAIKERGIDPQEVVAQIDIFKKGFSPTRLIRPCTVNDGITVLSREKLSRLGSLFEEACLKGRAMKFVPASGAASRMFKTLLSTYHRLRDSDSKTTPELMKADSGGEKTTEFINNLEKFAFYQDLKEVISKQGMDLEDLRASGHWETILEYALTPQGLNLSELPKGLVKFHQDPHYSRTPFEEHLVEAVNYVRDRENLVRLHFTVAQEHLEKVQDHLSRAILPYVQENYRFEITYSVQKPSTDTVAVDLDNNPFRDDSGRILFRPGGHGALLENLNDLEGDIIFIKNIDNIVPDSLKNETFFHKKALGGYLVEIQGKTFQYLRNLEQKNVNHINLDEIIEFAKNKLSINPPEEMDRATGREKRDFLYKKLNRPIRICGMVKNVAEPGGGPFWVEQPDKTCSPQIIEAAQVDLASKEQEAIWQSSTHFNPVDLVCGVRDHNGKPFDLMKYRDPETGFISSKSKEGRNLKALELPGLWNGSMSFWNTAFVEVPLITFNPVKTVFDLLRQEHQPR